MSQRRLRKDLIMRPILLEILAPMLSTSEMSCYGCNVIFDSLGVRSSYRRDAVNDYPEDWKQIAGSLTDWIKEISNLYRHRINIRVIDAQSPLGFWKQLRYRLFRFPAFIVDKKQTYVGWNPQELEALIDDRIHRTV